MHDPLDDEQAQGSAENADLSPRPVLRAVFYLLLILLGELAFEYWFTRQFSRYSIRPVLSGFFLPVFISTGLEILRWWFRRRRGELTTAHDPLWFQIVEGAMAIWILFLAAAFIRLYLL